MTSRIAGAADGRRAAAGPADGAGCARIDAETWRIREVVRLFASGDVR
jgi:hypothetical protein